MRRVDPIEWSRLMDGRSETAVWSGPIENVPTRWSGVLLGGVLLVEIALRLCGSDYLTESVFGRIGSKWSGP